MKIGEKIHFHDSEGKMVVEQVFDNAPYLESVKRLEDAGIDSLHSNKECKLAGRIPMHLVNDWLKEAGLKWSDTQAVKDLIRSKLLSGEFDRLRPWKGTY